MKKLGKPGREVRLGIIGLGARGRDQMCTILGMPEVKAAIVCDNFGDRAEKAADLAAERQGFRPDATKNPDDVFARDDIEGVVIMTSWQTHIPLAVQAMKAGKIPAIEVGGATSVESVWEMVRTSRETGVPLMFLENCCYDRNEMAVLNMVRKGLFGELVHCEGGYCHDLRDEIGYGDRSHHYRMDNFMHRNGELYPTHALGPILKYLNIGRGNAILTVSSFASKARGMREWCAKNRKDLVNPIFNEGDVVTTVMRCANGETITLTHDCTLPRAYSRRVMVQGTRGVWQEDGAHIYIEGVSPGRAPGDWCEHWQNADELLRKYEHPLWKKYIEFGRRGGHGGMDYLALRGYVEGIQNHTPMPIDVYDAAVLMAVTPLSEASIALGGAPVPMPDFTNGAWLTRQPEDLGTYSLDIIPR